MIIKIFFCSFVIRIIHENGYSKEECYQFKLVIHGNTIQSLSAILHAMKKLNINFMYPDSLELSCHYFCYIESEISPMITPELAIIMKKLWHDPNVQLCFRRSREYQLNDSAY